MRKEGGMMHTFDITIEGLSKMEGHADLHVKVRNDKVEDVKFMILENRRFYEQAVQHVNIHAAPQLLSRICGTCSLAHQLCSIKSIEHALKIVPSEQTVVLRNLAMYGLMIRDHGLHLGFFSLPDLLGKDSILDFDEKNEKEHKLLHNIFDIKQAGNDLSTLVAGRAVHGTFPLVGGFSAVPAKEKSKDIIKKLKDTREKAISLIEIFENWKESFITPTEFASLTNDDFSFLNGHILARTAKGKRERVTEDEYLKHLHEVVIPYSTSKGYEFEGNVFMVGALARINQNKKNLHNETKKDVKLDLFPSFNVFENNLAQAIEILHSIDSAVELLEKNEFKRENPVVPKKNSGEGVGVIEAPRGLLYHYFDIKNSKIVKAKVIVPSSQNQIKMDKDIASLVESLLPKKNKKDIEWEIEKLIRAYDPCMSCAAHFLKVKWQ
jgi:coenzyme F420-reducing hydrogenase alpha subunit